MERAPGKALAFVAALVLATAASVSGVAWAAPPAPADGGPAALVRWTGDPSSATGAALGSGACDVNGDGRDDAVVGGWFWDKGATGNIGATYVLLGGSTVRGGPLADPAEAGAVRIDGPATANAFTGFAVACVGDVNGDDLDDIAISHYTAQRTYVVFGADPFTGVTLDALGDRGFTIQGGPGGNLGFSIAPVGDLNDDGLADLGVAEVVADTLGRTNNGRVWVIAGQDDISDVDLVAPAAGQVLLSVDGAISEERLGNIASIGDVNGDQVDDFLLGSYTSTPWGASVAVPGAAYVVFGGTTGAVDLADLGSRGFTIAGPTRQRDRLGISVSGAGDINGDGLADLLIGADGVANAATGPRNGGAAVVFGSASTDRVYTDPTAASGQSVFTCAGVVTDPGACASPVRRGYWIDGAAANDSTGYSVAGVGDVNGDAVPDVAIGAYGFDPVGSSGNALSGAGAVYVVFGAPTATVQSLASLPATAGYRIDGLAAGDRFGRQVASIGDLDGNGSADMAFGADFAARPASQNGEVTVALMGLLASTTTLAVSEPTPVAGQVVRLEADVLVNGEPASAGTVAFSSDGATVRGCRAVAVDDGFASCLTSWSGRGGHQVTATYSGSALATPSTSAPVTVDVGSDAIVRPDAAPSGVYGSSGVTFTGVVLGSGQNPTGSVSIRSGSTVLGTGTLSSGRYSVSLGATALLPGTQALTVEYGGDSRYRSDTAPTSATIAKAQPTVAVTISPARPAVGDPYTVLVEVTAEGVVPRSTVQVRVDGTTEETAELDESGTASVAMPGFPNDDDHTVQAVYAGSDTVAAGSSPVTTVSPK